MLLSHGELTGGSKLTMEITAELGKPWKHVNLAASAFGAAIHEIQHWLASISPRVLNIAGPWTSEDPDIYTDARIVLQGVFVNEVLDVS